MIEVKTTYIPLGTRVLLKIKPTEKSLISLPDGVKKPGIQRFDVIAVGGMVNAENFKLQPGDVVQLTSHPGSLCGTDQEQEMITVDRSEINVIVV